MMFTDIAELAVAEGIAPDDIFGIEDFVSGYLDCAENDIARDIRRMINTNTQ